MPAQTHEHGEVITPQQVIDLLAAVSGVDELAVDASLLEIGLIEELDILSFWDAVAEEYAERSLGDPDLSDLWEATTVTELADAIVRYLNF